MKAKCVGTINLGNEVTISDPCYDSGIWCSITFKNLLEGNFKCYTWNVRNTDCENSNKNHCDASDLNGIELNAGLFLDAFHYIVSGY